MVPIFGITTALKLKPHWPQLTPGESKVDTQSSEPFRNAMVLLFIFLPQHMRTTLPYVHDC